MCQCCAFFDHYITISKHQSPEINTMLCPFLLWPFMHGGAALKSLRLHHHLNFSLSWHGIWMLTSKYILFGFFERSVDNNKQPNLGQFGFTKQTKRSDDNSAPATVSLPVLLPPLTVAASDSTEERKTSGPDTTAATCSDLGDQATPCNWTTKQWSEWKNRNTWLFSKNHKLGCTVCMEAKSLLIAERATGVHLSEEWMNGEVSSESQNNLRKKIYKHRDSLAHRRAVEISEMREKDVLPNKVLEVNAHLMQETATSFRSAYMVAKEKMAYRKLPAVLSLQKLNGANVGNVHKDQTMLVLK